MSEIKFEIKSELLSGAQTLTDTLVKRWVSDTYILSKQLAGYFITKALTGGTSEDRLGVRSGNLRRTTRALQSENNDGLIEGGVAFGAKYAKTHISRDPQTTIIKPKRTRFLSVPLKAALHPSGVPKQPSARDYDDLFVLSRQGNRPSLLVRRNDQGELVPMYVLLPRVKVRSRVHTRPILEKFKKIHVGLLSKSFREVFG